MPPHETLEATPEKAVVFADSVLGEMVRASMGKQEGEITAAGAEAVMRLNLSIEWKRYASEDAPIKVTGGRGYCHLNLLVLFPTYHR